MTMILTRLISLFLSESIVNVEAILMGSQQECQWVEL